MRRAFSLIELLVVISIVAALVGILLPVVSMVRDSSRALTCGNNLRQLGICFASYANDWEGNWPAPQKWHVGLWNHFEDVDYWATPQVRIRHSIFACPLLRNTLLISTAEPGYAMTISLPPCKSNTDFATAIVTHPLISQFRSSATTPVMADSASDYNKLHGKPQGDFHLGDFGTWAQANLTGYVHRNRANLLLGDGHIVASTLEQMPSQVVQTPINPPAATPFTY